MPLCRRAQLRAAADSGRPALAAELAAQHLAEQPEDADALLHYGMALHELRRFADAGAAYERALAAAAPDARGAVHQQLGLLAQQQGAHDAAGEWFTRVIADRPADASGYLLLGELHAALGRLDEAERWLTRATGCAEGPVGEAHRALGLALRSQGRYVEALAPLRRALAWDPADTAAQDALLDLEGVLFEFPAV